MIVVRIYVIFGFQQRDPIISQELSSDTADGVALNVL